MPPSCDTAALDPRPAPLPNRRPPTRLAGATHIRYRVVNGRKGRPAQYSVAPMGLH
jgi:hypothetical protein